MVQLELFPQLNEQEYKQAVIAVLVDCINPVSFPALVDLAMWKLNSKSRTQSREKMINHIQSHRNDYLTWIKGPRGGISLTQ